MIAIGCATTDERAFRAHAAPTIQALDDGSCLLLRRHRYDSIDAPYDEMLAAAAARDDLEAIALVHQDAILGPEGHALGQAMALLAAEPDVAVVGALDDDGPPREVATVDGTLLLLSAWAARNLRFEPAVGGSADASAQDVSLQARAGGRRVVGMPLGVARARIAADPVDRRRQLHAMVALRRKWELPC